MKGTNVVLTFISISSFFFSILYFITWPYFIYSYLNEKEYIIISLTILPVSGLILSLICAIWLGKSYIIDEINKLAEKITNYLTEDIDNLID